MEIKSTNSAFFNSLSVSKLQNMIGKLDTRLFKAIVIAKVGQESFIINTSIGKFQVMSDLPLAEGDELSLQVNHKKAHQSSLDIIQIVRPNTTEKPVVANRANTPLLIISPSDIKNITIKADHFVAIVSSKDNKQVHLKTMSGEHFSLNKTELKQPSIPLPLDKGTLLIFKRTSIEHIEVKTITKEHLLTQVQQQLIPKQTTETQPFKQLSQAVFKLFKTIENEIKHLKLKTKASSPEVNIRQVIKEPQNQIIKKTIDSKQALDSPINQKLTLAASLPRTSPELNSNKFDDIHQKLPRIETAIKTIQHDLKQFIQKHQISAKLITPETVSRFINQLSLLHQDIKTVIPNTPTISQLDLIKQSIDELLIDLNKLAPKKTTQDDEPFLEQLKTAIKDLKQPIESTISKLLFQSVNAKINQESNQNVLIQTQIPIEIEKQTKDVKLKIKQHKPQSDQQDDIWEILLSFEFATLGLISTKIILKESTQVSILFWAEYNKTKQLLEEKQSIFKQQMSNSGFTLESINIVLGKKIPEETKIDLPSRQLIDINV